MNNDNLVCLHQNTSTPHNLLWGCFTCLNSRFVQVGYLAEWLEDIRKDHDVPVYGVITKLDTQEQGLSSNSPIKKVS